MAYCKKPFAVVEGADFAIEVLQRYMYVVEETNTLGVTFHSEAVGRI